MWSLKFGVVFICLLQLVACGGGGGGGGDTAVEKSPQQTISLEFSILPISSNTQPVLTVKSNANGRLSINDSCAVENITINIGSNSITLPKINDGVYSNCVATFVSDSGESQSFSVPKFEIDTSAPTLKTQYVISAFSSNKQPEFKFHSSEIGRLSISGQCQTDTKDIDKGDNVIQFNDLADGSYSDCQIGVIDLAGNLSNRLEVKKFTVDSQAPSISIPTNVNRYTKSKDAEILVSANESVTIALSNGCAALPSVDGVAGTTSIALAILGEGVFNNCTLIATDRAGNTSQSVLIAPFTIDDTAPRIDEISPVTSPTNSRINQLNLRLSEQGRFFATGDCQVPETQYLSGDQTLTITAEIEGNISIGNCQIKLTDLAGNSSSNIDITAFTIDTLGPELGITKAISAITSDNTPQVVISTNENASLEYQGACTSSTRLVIEGSNTIDLNQLVDGEYSDCKIRALDGLKNVSTWLTLATFKIDTAKPQLALTKALPKKSDNQSPLLIFSSTEVGTITFSGSCDSDSVNAVKGQNNVVMNELSVGTYTDCSLMVTDPADNQSEPLSLGEFEIVPLPASLAIWQGVEDSIITPSAARPGDLLYRSRQENCDLDNYAACSLGQVNSLGGSKITDTAFNRDNNAFAKIRASSGIVSPDALLTINAGINTYPNNQTIVFNGKVLTYDGNRLNRSSDGKYWEGSTIETTFGHRKGHQIVEFNNKLWMIAGVNNHGNYTSKVLSSVNGDSWRFESEVEDIIDNRTIKLNGRSGHQVVVFKNKLWLIGGKSNSGYKADVWSSSNGRFWDRETDFAPFGRRANHKAVVFQDKIFVIGGKSGISNDHKDTWSFDGMKWQRESDSNPFGALYGMDISFFNGKWILVGGYGIDSSPYSKKDVWQSDDLVIWSKLSEDENLANKQHQSLFVLKNKLWITGEEGLLFSENAIEWKKVNKPKGSYSARYAHRTVSFNGDFWLIGGAAAKQTSGEIYKSSDGIQWQLVSETAPFGSRKNHTLTEFKGRLWVIAGDTSNGLSNDVWVSDDGSSWTLVTEEAAFTKREGQMVVATNDAMYLMGGDDDNGYWNLKDVWRSTDGDTWSLITSSAGYTQSQRPDAEYFNNKLWIFDGAKIYSANIETPAVWSQVERISQRADHHNEVEIHNGVLFMYTYHGKLLSSVDGTTWIEVVSDEYRLPKQLQNSQLVSKDGYLWILGGRFGVNNSYLGNTWRYSAADGWRILLKREIPFY